ncbi:MAG: phosphopyruvate hydratase [Candidatus Bathyarchaeota archaeon]|nr:phosphopyruvate hydratase [Candidatus Bathyarchaeota archaeon]MDH5713381.1 phosphopyruvate hydratase [Candidatus Bathyarchaeota archaeon]
MSTVIEDVTARKIFDSRGEQTLEVDITTTVGFGRASAPSGASRGKAEVMPYPEGGVDQAIRKVEELIAPELIGMNAEEQEQIDILLHKIDGTKDFRNIGGNTAYSVSLAIADAASSSYGIPLFQQLGGYLASELPYPLGNVLGGGRHAHGKAPDIQEFLVLPLEAASFSEAAKANVLVHKRVGSLLRKSDGSFTGGRGDEGAWAPSMKNEEALETMMKACEEVSEELGVKCGVGVDMAASTLWRPKEKRYVYARDGVERNAGDQVEFVLRLIKDYNLVYVEDPFHEEDFESFAELTKRVKKCLICGDDLFVTNKQRLAHGVRVGAANAVIIKTNQVGTLTEAWETTKMARKARYIPVMSHRSGETTDVHLAHLAVAFQCPVIKTGVIPGDRAAKINELIRVEEALGDRAKMSTLPL